MKKTDCYKEKRNKAEYSFLFTYSSSNSGNVSSNTLESHWLHGTFPKAFQKIWSKCQETNSV